MAYKKVVKYLFEVGGERWYAEKQPNGTIDISETRNNGQEDTHMEGVLELNEKGKWQWESEENTIRDYAGEKMAFNILKYINSNPLPND